jgi:hypothetical protein
MYSNAQYYDHSKDVPFGTMSIRVDINGMQSFVPIDEANLDYQNIMKLVRENNLTVAAANNQGFTQNVHTTSS